MTRVLEPSAAPARSIPKVGIVSLGCPKALVDSERIVTRLRAEGYQIAPDYDGADLVLVNTCGFLDSAREESLDAIGEAMARNGQVIVTGCLGAEPEVIRARHPNVLAITGPQQYETVMQAVHAVAPPRHDPFLDLVPEAGVKLTPRHYAYLKISEGCDNSCSFCIIPKLRGGLASRPAAHVVAEAEKLVAAGVKELLVISQDTSDYGRDIGYAQSAWQGRTLTARFFDLCQALGEVAGPGGEKPWVRLHYVYPYPHVDKVIPLMAQGLVAPYLDIPFQHASPRVLKAMRRPANQLKQAARIKAWRETCPDLAIRSTFIVGFPGETEEDFAMLLDFIEEGGIDRVGCFKYENVVHAPSRDLPDHVPEEVKQARWERFMAVAQGVSARRLAAKVGRTVECIVDEIGEDGPVGRTIWDAPEIDGTIALDGFAGVRVGDRVRARIVEADEYDLVGEAV
jgi:ribosomal protein S12 methylthiotransferase